MIMFVRRYVRDVTYENITIGDVVGDKLISVTTNYGTCGVVVVRTGGSSGSGSSGSGS
jgi:hypothetical protein